jgi:hypothetical protein
LVAAAEEEVDEIVESFAEVFLVDIVSERGFFEGAEGVAVEEGCSEVEPVFVDEQKWSNGGGWQVLNKVPLTQVREGVHVVLSVSAWWTKEKERARE